MRIFYTVLMLATIVPCVVRAQPDCNALIPCFQASQVGPFSFLFNNCSSASAPGFIQHMWDFGDGNQSTETSPTYSYATTGNYSVCLTTYWSGCVDSVCTTIEISGGFDCADFTAFYTWNPGLGTTVDFIGGTNYPADSLVWYFEPGSTPIFGSLASHTFTAPGTYYPCMSAGLWNPQTQTMCWTEACQTIEVSGPPPCDSSFFAAFGYSTDGSLVMFQATSGGLADGYLWDFGDGSQGGGQFQSHVYAPGGPYQACLQAWYWNGSDTCWTEPVCQEVGPFTNPCDLLDATFTPFITGLAVNFQNAGVDPTWTYYWDFGDGSTAFGPSAGHTYPGPTLYQVCLTVWTWDPLTQDTCFATSCQTIDLTGGGDPCDQLEACFQPSQLSSNAFFFNNCSSGPVPGSEQYLWSFGDGSASTEVSPLHTFPGPGVYEVCLSAFWQGCVDSTCTTLVVGDGVAVCDSAFFAAFGFSAIDNEVLFQATSGGQADGYLWNFGDGSFGEGQSSSHTYTGIGPYTVCLSAWYWNGLDTCWTEPACVPVGPFDPCMGLEACFTTEDLGGGTVAFTNCSPLLINSQYGWSFGDGSSTAGLNTTHTYAQPGSYIACLTFLWDNCLDTACTTIDVGNSMLCDSTFFAAFAATAQDNFVTFQATSGGQADGYVWNFGDGQSGTGSLVTHTYSGAGPYTACLTAWYLNGNDTCWTEPVCQIVGPFTSNPCDALDAGFTYSVNGLSVSFQADTVAGTWGYAWDFGDGSQAYEPNVTHVYPGPTIFQACLTVWTWDPIAQDTCFASSCQLIDLIGGGVTPCDTTFSVAFDWQANGPTVVFVGTSSIPANGFIWDLGDGSTGWTQVYTHIYEPPGPFQVCLSAWYWTGSDSCWATTCESVDPFTMGIGDGVPASRFLVFPNPAHDQLYIKIRGPLHNAWLELIRADGALVRTARSSGSQVLDLNGLLPGLYVLRITTDQGYSQHKVMVE